MGPFHVRDTQGIGLAVVMLLRSLDRGRHQSTLQFESVRKMRSSFSNIWHASSHTLTTSVMARDKKKTCDIVPHIRIVVRKVYDWCE